MSGNITVTTDKQAFQSAIEAGLEAGVDALAQQMMNDSDPIIPYREGDLFNSGRINKTGVSGERELEWQTPYALAMWYGSKAWHWTKVGTGPAWVDTARDSHSNDWEKAAQNGFSGGMK